jgi:hypothetical protein
MTGPEAPPTSAKRPVWLAASVGGAIAAMAAISALIYFGLAARSEAWPIYVLAAASAPLVLLAVVQAIQGVAHLVRKKNRGNNGGQQS